MSRRGPSCSNFEPHKFRPGFCLHCLQRSDQHVSGGGSNTNTVATTPVNRSQSPGSSNQNGPIINSPTTHQLPKRPLPAPPSENNSLAHSQGSPTTKPGIPAKPLPVPPGGVFTLFSIFWIFFH